MTPLGCFDAAPFAVIVLGCRDGRVHGISAAWHAIAGTSPAAAPRSRHALESMVDARDRERFAMLLDGGRAARGEGRFRIVRPDGDVRHVLAIAYTHRAERSLQRIVTIVDQTARVLHDRAAADAVREDARVEQHHVLYELTSSIAHEVNQPLAAIAMNAGAALRWLFGRTPNPDEARQALDRIASDATRAGETIRRLRARVRHDAGPSEPVDLNAVVHEAVDVARHVLERHDVHPVLDLAEAPPMLTGRRAELRHVVASLVAAAAEAMAGADRRARSIRIRTVVEDNAIRLELQAHGAAIPEHTRMQAIDAFFAIGGGTAGMALAIGRRIVEAHGGSFGNDTGSVEGMFVDIRLPMDGHPGDREAGA